ncbi:hypothetical protein L6164_012175 [Bauhinia variegata]|uniref:Uncharacterized protein n=1 Tax=Bauhinia variegata TaxID=167791 RepID=A0ACB9PEF1_BAUVA|nr:hypothetical protein L6164_012175 [Bauhinia variegata]
MHIPSLMFYKSKVCCEHARYTVGHPLISWKSKKKSRVSRSFAEAEHRALDCVTNELLWLKQLCKAFEIPISSVMVFCDNISAIQLASNPILF